MLVRKKASWYLDGPHDDNIRWHDVAMMVLNVGDIYDIICWYCVGSVCYYANWWQ